MNDLKVNGKLRTVNASTRDLSKGVQKNKYQM